MMQLRVIRIRWHYFAFMNKKYGKLSAYKMEMNRKPEFINMQIDLRN